MVELTQALDLDQLSTDEVLDRLVLVRKALAGLKASNEALLDRLDQLAEAGKVDQGGFTHQDWAFSWSAGRKTWSYPEPVLALEQQLKTARKASEADGSALPTTGAPYWTIREPRP